MEVRATAVRSPGLPGALVNAVPATSTASMPAPAVSGGGAAVSGLDINSSNVGPRIGLTTYSGDWSVNSQGSPSGRDISGRILLDKAGTYRDFRARDGAYVSAPTGVVIEYADLGPASGNGSNGGTGVAIVWGDYTIRYSHVHNFSDGMRLNGGTVEFCWVHDLTLGSAGDHNDGIQTTEGSNIVIRGSRITRKDGQIQTSCLMIAADQGNISNVLIEDNLFESNPGFQVAVYWGHGGSFTATGCTIRNNYFTNTFTTFLSNNDPYVGSGNRFVSGSEGAWTPGALIAAVNNA